MPWPTFSLISLRLRPPPSRCRVFLFYFFHPRFRVYLVDVFDRAGPRYPASAGEGRWIAKPLASISNRYSSHNTYLTNNKASIPPFRTYSRGRTKKQQAPCVVASVGSWSSSPWRRTYGWFGHFGVRGVVGGWGRRMEYKGNLEEWRRGGGGGSGKRNRPNQDQKSCCSFVHCACFPFYCFRTSQIMWMKSCPCRLSLHPPSKLSTCTYVRVPWSETKPERW